MTQPLGFHDGDLPTGDVMMSKYIELDILTTHEELGNKKNGNGQIFGLYTYNLIL